MAERSARSVNGAASSDSPDTAERPGITHSRRADRRPGPRREGALPHSAEQPDLDTIDCPGYLIHPSYN